MSFRARLTLVAAVAVAVAVAIASVVVYLAVRSELRGQVDDALDQRADTISQIPIEIVQTRPGQFFLRIPAPALGGPGGYVQVVTRDGGTLRPAGEELALPVDDRTRELAAGGADAYYSDAEVAGTHVRI
ncbi:MAG: hypothetical protein ACRDOP_13730, partial [Gaiellaceae bacterium]